MKISEALQPMVWLNSFLLSMALLTPASAADGIAGLVCQALQAVEASPCLHSGALRNRARNITVKILTGDQWSSGILIRRRELVYTVLTNQHVLRAGTAYRVQMADGRVYPATVSAGNGFGDNDLAVLHFRSRESYAIATLGTTSRSLPVGTPTFAAGFPIPGLPNSTPGFRFTTGQVSLVAPKALEGGYQIGYTNIIEKGMSGGPVLNARGEVIAINGVHQEPLWGDPYLFADGSKPPAGLRSTLVNSSWAIPVETFRKHSL